MSVSQEFIETITSKFNALPLPDDVRTVVDEELVLRFLLHFIIVSLHFGRIGWRI